MRERFRSGAGLLAALLMAGCANSPHTNDPFEVGSAPGAPPHVYGGEPMSRSEYNELTAPQYGPPGSYGSHASSEAQAPAYPYPGGTGAEEPSPRDLAPRSSPLAPDAYQAQADVYDEAVQPVSEPTVYQVESPASIDDAIVDAQPAAPVESDALLEARGYEEPAGNAQAQSLATPEVYPDEVTAAGDPSPFANAPDHSWLRGQLEYSHVEGAWKLRYAPIDVENDPYGGSVVLGNDPRLRDYQEGDVIYVEGQPKPGRTGVFSSGPRYEIRQITLLEKP